MTLYNKYKSKAYRELVKEMQKRYPKYDFENPEKNTESLYAPYVNGEYICKEINFYTYWQGLGYAEKTPKIKYLFVGQDNGGGRLFDNSEETQEFIENIKKMNDGDKSVPYIDDKINKSETDKNLVELFKDFDYDLHQRHEDLFFTNFCLGYRRDSGVSMQIEWMMEDADLFKKLYEILEPENIITMGMRTFQCVYETLKGEPYPRMTDFKDFMELVSSHKKIVIKRGRNSIPIYPIHHCGKHGIENLIADPLAILRSHLLPIKENRQSPFAEYLFKLIDEYKSKHNGKAPELNSEAFTTKILSDLRCGKTNALPKLKVISIIFALKLSADKAYTLLAKANYTRSKYIEDRFNEDIKFDIICVRYIDKQNFNEKDINEDLSDNFLNTIPF